MALDDDGIGQCMAGGPHRPPRRSTRKLNEYESAFDVGADCCAGMACESGGPDQDGGDKADLGPAKQG
jgi:hypothetical protein